MKASVYYTLKSPPAGPAFSEADVGAMSHLAEKLKKEGHSLVGIYITDTASSLCVSAKELIYRDASLGVFDLLYLYIYGIPTAIPACRLSDILDLPVNGCGPIFD